MELNILKRLLSSETFQLVEQEVNEARQYLADLISPGEAPGRTKRSATKRARAGATVTRGRGRRQVIYAQHGTPYPSKLAAMKAVGFKYPYQVDKAISEREGFQGVKLFTAPPKGSSVVQTKPKRNVGRPPKNVKHEVKRKKRKASPRKAKR